MKPESLQNVINLLRSLPGVGKKQSEKIAFYLLLKQRDLTETLLRSLQLGLEQLQKCTICNHVSDTPVCLICQDQSRTKQLMIVESATEVFKFEAANIYTGKYHIMPALINVANETNVAQLQLEQLAQRVAQFDEIILAISPTLAGEATAIYITSFLAQFRSQVSRLAIGIPVGADVEYVDHLTLKLAFKNRRVE